jgi:tripartite-type tricarboxylate transporter receptor subunit TctC
MMNWPLEDNLMTHASHTVSIARRWVLSALALLLPAAALPVARAADAWPSKPLRIIVPFAPGGGADSSARVLAESMGPQLGQSIVVENRPGAGSAIGVTAAAQSRDGHTLLMGSNSMVINPSLQPSLGYDVARDFDAIGMVSAQPLVLVVPADSKIQSVKDLIAQAKAAPGSLSAGNSGNGTLAHIASEIFASQTATSLTPVPYKGESALMPDLISGRISSGFLNLPSVISPIKSGRLRALAVSSPQPVAELPGVPTFRSLGLEPLEVQGWAALVAPRGTIPPEGLARLAAALNTSLASEEVRKRFANVSVTPLPMSREASGQFLSAETARYAAIIKARGIKLD